MKARYAAAGCAMVIATVSANYFPKFLDNKFANVSEDIVTLPPHRNAQPQTSYNAQILSNARTLPTYNKVSTLPLSGQNEIIRSHFFSSIDDEAGYLNISCNDQICDILAVPKLGKAGIPIVSPLIGLQSGLRDIELQKIGYKAGKLKLRKNSDGEKKMELSLIKA